MTTQDTITIEASEVEGVRHWIEFLLERDDAFPNERVEWHTAHARIGWLLDVDDALDGCVPPVQIHVSPFLADFAREGGEYGAELFIDALRGKAVDPEDASRARMGGGLISFADRLGVYEGEVV